MENIKVGKVKNEAALYIVFEEDKLYDLWALSYPEDVKFRIEP
jgi:hypothetical protein